MKAFFLRLIRPIEWSLLTKLLVTFGLLVMIPLVLLGLYSYDVARHTVLQAQRQALISHTNDLAAHLDILLIERQANIRQLAEDSAVQAFNSAWPQVSPEIQAAALEDLDNLFQANPYFQAVYLMNREGEVILSSTDNAGLNFSFRPYFQEALAGKAYVSDISISIDLREPVIYFSAPVRDKSGEVVAVAVLRVLAEEIWSSVEAVKDELGPGSVAILFDEYGIRLAHASDRSLIFKAVVPLDPEVEAQLLAERRLGDMEKIESTNFPELAEGLRQADSQPYFTHRLAIRDELFHAGAARLTVKPWTVIETVPESAFLTPVREMMSRTAIGVGTIAMMSIIVSILATLWIIHPVRELATAAQRLAGGELDHPIARFRVQRGDEIGLLLQSFETMRIGLQELYARLEARNRRLQRLYELAMTLAGGVTDVSDRVVSIIAELLEIKVAMVEEIHQDQIKVISMYDHGQIIHEGVFPLQGTPCANVQDVKDICHYTEAVEQFPEDPFLVEHNLNTYIGVPILDSRGEALGVVNAMDDHPREFDDEDVHLLQTLAKRVSFEIEQAQAEAELRRRAGELEAIAEVGGLVTASGDLQATLDTLAKKITRASGFEGVAINLYDPEKEELTCHTVFANGSPKQLLDRKGVAKSLAELPILQQMMQGKQPAFIPPSTRGGMFTLPLLYAGKLIGTLELFSNRPQHLSPDEFRLLSTLADQTAAAVQNARLFQEAQRHNLLMTRLAATSEDLNRTFTLSEVATAIGGEGALTICECDRVAVYLRQPDDSIICAWAQGLSPTYIQQAIDRFEEMPGSQLREKLDPILIPDTSHLPEDQTVRELSAAEGYRAVALWPLVYEGRTIAAVGVYYDLPHFWSAAEQEVMTAFSRQAAVALVNARLFGETQQRLRELSILLDLSARLRSLVRKEDLLLPIIECTSDGLNADCAAIFTLDSHTNEILVQKTHGECDEHITNRTLSVEALPAACAMHSGQPCFGQDDCPFFLHSGGSSKLVCMPLKIGNRILGALYMDTHRPEGFHEENVRLLSGIADIAANSLRRAEFFEEVRLYKDAFNSTADAITITDLDSHILDINPGFERMTGYSREKALNKTPRLIKSRHSTPEFYRQMWDQILNQGYWSGEVINRRKDGEEWYSDLTISTIRDELGQPVAYLGINRDITERKRRERQREALLTVASALRQAPTKDEMLPVILDQVLTLTESGGATLTMWDPTTGDMVIELGRGKWQTATGIRLKEGEGITGLVMDSGEVYLSDDLSSDPRLSRPDLLAGLKTGICVPLMTQEQAIGVMWVGRALPFSDEEVRLLTAIGDMAANAIQRASLHEQTERRLKQTQALRTIDQAISASQDLRLTLNILLEQVTTNPNVDAAAVSVLIPNTGMLEIYSRRGFHTGALQPATLRLGHSLAGRAALENRILSIADLSEAGDELEAALLLAQEGFTSYHAVPLVAKGQVKGVLEIFHRSPFDPGPEWLEFLESLAIQAAIAMDNAELFQNLQRSNQELIQAYDATLEGWVRALDLRDKETEDHTQRVTEMTLRLARAMGIREDEMVHVRRGALLHDIGKMGIPDRILHKPGKLTDQEWEIMRKHPVYAYHFLAPIDYLRPALDIPYCHHEKWDGSGYPRGLKGKQIPKTARIFAGADVWDALSSDRPYRKAWPKKKVLQYLKEQSGLHFDPAVVEVFLELI